MQKVKYHDPQFNEAEYRGLYHDRAGGFGLLQDIATTLYSGTVDLIPETIARTARAFSGGVHVQQGAWYDRWIAEQARETRQRGVSLQTLSGDELRREATQGLRSLPLSLATQASGYLGGRFLGAIAAGAAGAETGPGAVVTSAAGRELGGKAGAAILTGAVFAALTKDSFEEQAFQQFKQENPQGTEEQWQAWKTAHHVDRNGWIAGGAEGASEGIGKLIGFGLTKFGSKMPKDLAKKYAGKPVLSALVRIVPILKSLGQSWATGVAEETASRLVQTHLEANSGLREKPQTLGEVAWESGLPGGFAELFREGIRLAAKGGVRAVSRATGSTTVNHARDLAKEADAYVEALAKQRTAIDANDAAGQVKQRAAAETAMRNAGEIAASERMTVPDLARKALAKITDPTGDFEAQEKALTQDAATGFAAAEIGRTVRDEYVSGDREAMITQVVNKLDVPPAIASTIVDQHAAMAAVGDLQTVLRGQPIDAAKAAKLQSLGLLHAETTPNGGGSWKVTDDALPLLPPPYQKAVLANGFPKTFAVTPGTPGDVWSHLTSTGFQRLAEATAPQRQETGLERNAGIVAETPEELAIPKLPEDVANSVDAWVEHVSTLFPLVEESEALGPDAFSISPDGKTFRIYWKQVRAEVSSMLEQAQTAGGTYDEVKLLARNYVRTLFRTNLDATTGVFAGNDARTIAIKEAARGEIMWVNETLANKDALDYEKGAAGWVDGKAPRLSAIDERGIISVKFDGIDGGTLVDRKTAVTMHPKIYKQLVRQSAAAAQNGYTVRWEVPKQGEARRVLKLISILGIKNIQVMVVPRAKNS